MLVTIIAPECVLGKALADLYAAHLSVREMRRYAKSDGAKWGLTHAFFANMGGFVLTQKLEGNSNDGDNCAAGGHPEPSQANQDDLENEAPDLNSIEVAPETSGERASHTLLSREKDALNKRESSPDRSGQHVSDQNLPNPGRLSDMVISDLVVTRDQPQQLKRQLVPSKESHIKDNIYLVHDPEFRWNSFLPRCRITSIGDAGLDKLNMFKMAPKPSIITGESKRLPGEHGGRVSALGSNIFESKLLKGTTGMIYQFLFVQSHFAETTL